jgi:molybdopterin-guanine dinucleotide biosynthesis adapter protein
MRRVHVVGRKNHGKTTLISDLVRTLTARRIRVGTIKHSFHDHELDSPGTDTHKHRLAGAAPAAIVTRDLIGVWRPRQEDEDGYAVLAPLYADRDLVIVEGDRHTDRPKIEVWRREIDAVPMAMEDRSTDLLVTDDDPPDGLPCPAEPRADVDAIADALLELLAGDAP